jgi:hypothetical protein
MRTFLILLVACGGKETDTGTETDADTDTDSDTDTDTDTDTDADPADTMLPCEDLPFTVSCTKVVSGYDVCADYFGANTEALIRPQCEGGGGVLHLEPCDVPDRFGTCVYFNPDAPDYCYMEHIAGDPSGAAFWESTCPAVGGEWVPR